MINFINTALFHQYGLRTYSVKEVPGGWSASAFAVKTDKGTYFVKVYDKHRPSVRPWIERMELYMPVVLWLSDSTPLGKHMIAPILTKNNGYKVENQEYMTLVFPFVKGKTLGEVPLTSSQITQLANTLALLHSYKEETIPVPIQPLKETYLLSFSDALLECFHEKNVPLNLQKALGQHENTIRKSLCILQSLAERLHNHSPCYALCHTDVHGGNVMWGNQLFLIDWEGLRLAPVESDLFSFTDGFFFDYARKEFFSSYEKVHPGYTVNETAMTYYRLHRRLGDISEFAHSIANDSMTAEETSISLSFLEKECTALGDILLTDKTVT